MQQIYRMFAHYNAWANGQLYDAVAALPEADYRADQGAFFGSLQGTLNHILVGDRVWLRRFTGEGPLPARLDEILFERFDALRAARQAEDARIISWVECLDETALRGVFTYVPIINPAQVTQHLAPALSHLFNHQTHHRGQAHALLTRLTGAAPSLDLIVFQRLSGMGMAGMETA